ncbi:MAG: thiamine diphosphokinase [Oscillospiraceae bacterium]|nr:thiamine diphosphokinase [Oscillospiraceae bacterium]
MSKRCFIFGGYPCNSTFDFSLSDNDMVICADGGVLLAERLGVQPKFAVGDFDTISVKDCCGKVECYPPEKDDTDMMIAVKTGFRLGYKDFVIFGGIGGRLDHTFANIQTLNYIADNGGRGLLLSDNEAVTVQLPEIAVYYKEDYHYISVFSLTETCEGVYLKGLKYPLENAVLTAEFPLGISNEFLTDSCCIELKKGRLLVIRAKNDKK